MVTIELTDKEAKVYLMLREARAFDVCGGQVVISFDGVGEPRYVDVTSRTLSTPTTHLTI